jgi:protein phosphatase-4 regulatory subunit 3
MCVCLQQEEAKILVASEDDPNRQLLETRISKDDGYQKQQGTPIWLRARVVVVAN